MKAYEFKLCMHAQTYSVHERDEIYTHGIEFLIDNDALFKKKKIKYAYIRQNE